MFPIILLGFLLYTSHLQKTINENIFLNLFITIELTLLLPLIAFPYNLILLTILFLAFYLNHLIKTHLNTNINIFFLKSVYSLRVKKGATEKKTLQLSLLLFLPILAASLLGFKHLLSLPQALALSPFFLVLLLPRKKKGKTNIDIRNVLPPGEVAHFRSPTTPLLRKHIKFTETRHTQLNLSNKKPHILLLFLESFKFYNPPEIKQASLTPYFQQLAKSSLFFENFYSPATITFRTLLAANYGLYPFYGSEFSKGKEKLLNTKLIGIPQILNEIGYQSHLICSYPRYFDRFGSFFAKHGFSTIKEQADIEKQIDCETNSWGVHDQYYYDYLTKYIKNLKSPTFINSSTTTNHYPFTAPKSFHSNLPAAINDPLQRAFATTLQYSDTQLKIFIEKLEHEGLLDNMILLIGGDHGFPIEHTTKNDPYFFMHKLYKESVHVPFLIYQKNISPKVIKTYHSHVDILPTIIDLFNLQTTHHSMGKSLLRKAQNSAVYFGNFMNKKPIVSSLGDPHNKAMLLAHQLKTLYEKGDKFCRRKTTTLKLDKKTDLTDKALNKRLYRQNELYALNLDGAHKLTDNALKSIPSSIEELSLKDTLFTSNGIATLIKRCSNLHTLNISNMHLLDPLEKALHHCKNLLSLTMDSNPSFTHSTVDHLSSKLEYLNIQGPIDQQALQSLVNKKLKIKELFFSMQEVTSLNIPSLLKLTLSDLIYLDEKALNNLSGLVELNINNIKPICDKHLLNLRTKHLKYLRIKNAQEITSLGLTALLNQPITILDLEKCSHFTMKEATIISQFKYLRSLNIKGASQEIIKALSFSKAFIC